MATYNIDIDLSQKCRTCGKGGVSAQGLCLECAVKEADKPQYHGGEYAEASPAVLTIARQIIDRYHHHLRSAKIGFLFRKEAPVRQGMQTWGQAKKVSDRDKVYMDYDFVIWVAEDIWNSLTTARREALIDHELCHCRYGDSGWTTIPHDIQEFTAVIERHGFWRPDLYRVEALAKRQQERLPGFEPEGRVEAVPVERMAWVEEDAEV